MGKSFETMRQICKSWDIRLTKDPISGFWLHYDEHLNGKQRYCRYLEDIMPMARALANDLTGMEQE